MLKTIADNLERFDASIDIIDCDRAETVIEAALGAARVFLGAMTVEVFYLSEISEGVLTNDNTPNQKKIPYFLRFAKSLDSNDKDALAKTERVYYDPKSNGVWSFAYQKNREVWVEDRWIEYEDNTRIQKPRLSEPVAMEDRVSMENMAAEGGEDRKIERKHNIFWNSVNAAIVIPFFYKLGSTFVENSDTTGLISHQTNGFISFEFKEIKRYDDEQLSQLCRIRESVADLIWKSHAWNDSLNGTSHAVKKFQEECSELSENFPFVKTGLFSLERDNYDGLTALVSRAFTAEKIVMQTCDGRIDELGLLEPREGIEVKVKKNHFAVFDLTEQKIAVDMLLGVMLSKKKPCLILHDNAEMRRHRLISEIELAERNGHDISPLLDIWFYEATQSGDSYLFFKGDSDDKREWREVWMSFLRKVKEMSEPFRMASDGLFPEEN